MAINESLQKNSTVCQECKATVSIYVCPGCRIRTCSLPCCRRHKERTGCNGKRDRTAFMPLGRMTDSNLRSDYFFLEEVLDQMPRNRKRARLAHNQNDGRNGTVTAATKESTPSPLHFRNVHSHKSRRLVEAARMRGITLQLMPPIMERHRKNTSAFSLHKDVIYWKVDLVVEPEGRVMTFSLSEQERDIMAHVYRKCFGKEYVEAVAEQPVYHLFLKKLPSSSSSPRFVKLGNSCCLKEALAGETIIEYPTIYYVPENQLRQFPTGSDKIVELSNDETPPIPEEVKDKV